MYNEITLRLLSFLEEEGAEFRILEHPAAKTSEESAKARGEDLKIGAKALLIKADGSFRLVVLSAALKLDSKAIKRHWAAKECRFASKEELFELTGLLPGSVPPFGRPVLPFPLTVDRSIERLERVAFNAGSLTTSVLMPAGDYLRLAGGDLADIGSGE